MTNDDSEDTGTAEEEIIKSLEGASELSTFKALVRTNMLIVSELRYMGDKMNEVIEELHGIRHSIDTFPVPN